LSKEKEVPDAKIRRRKKAAVVHSFEIAIG
jgi:hypothetical protein